VIRNKKQLIENGVDEASKRLREDACKILESALEAVDPEQAIYNSLRLDGDLFYIRDHPIDLSSINRIVVVGGGKASGLMAKAVEKILGDRIESGLINVLEGTEKSLYLERIRLNAASHPAPSSSGVEGVKWMLELTKGLGEDDLVIALISGGGSALMPYPAEGVGLDELQLVTDRLLKAGATINELNAVRKHLSAFKGGQFARHCNPALVISLILSDVIGDPLDTIASGPTAPDFSRFSDAVRVLEKYGLWRDAPLNVKNHIKAGINGIIPETPKDGDPIFQRVLNVIIANNVSAAEAAKRKADELGYESMILSTYIEGEASQVGRVIGGVAKEIVKYDRPVSKPAAVILGGETTVSVKGGGLGGRNQELALAASLMLDGLGCLVAAFGTDGIDGPTDAAGAMVDGYTCRRSDALGLDAYSSLAENDSYNYFKKLGALIITGPTGTNVNDLALILVG